MEDDTKEIQVVSMTYKDPMTSSTISLYHFVAGRLDEAVEYSNGQWSISAIDLSNNILHSRIESRCKRDLYQMLTVDEAKKFQLNTPKFIVTKEIPSDEEKINSLVPTRTEIEGRKAFTYSHPQNPDFFVRIFEPASPSDTEFHAPDEPSLWSKLVSFKLQVWNASPHYCCTVWYNEQSQKIENESRNNS